MRVGICALLLQASYAASALSPQEILRQAQREVFRLDALDGKSERVWPQSAVSLGGERLVTTCDSLDETRASVVLENEMKIALRIERRDAARNLCVLSVPGLDAQPASFSTGEPTPGMRVYAVSNVLGLGISISDGLVSGVRKFAGETYIQFTAPIAPGSEGGALYDVEGRVIGLIQYRELDGQNVNFAAPAGWIGEIGPRSQAAAAADGRGTKAVALNAESRFVELEKHARDWSEADPRNLDAWLWLGVSATRRGDAQTAEAAYRAAVKLEPASLAAGLGLVGALLRQQRAKRLSRSQARC